MVRLRLEHSLTDLEEGPSCGGEGDSQRFNVARKLGSTRAQDAVVRAVEGIKVFGADRCPMVQQEDGSWVLNSHSLVTEVALEDETYSSAVSRFLQIPNGLDGEEHSRYRALIDRYLTDEKVSALAPMFDSVADQVVTKHTDGDIYVDGVELGSRFAVRATCLWLGWDLSLEGELQDWVLANWAATRSGDPERMATVSNWYTDIVQFLIRQRREYPRNDVTSELIQDDSLGRPLTDEEIASILRNWTGGDLGSMALSIGVVTAYLADHKELQDHLRAGVSDEEFNAAIDEILRLDDPFLANRRITTKETTLDGTRLNEGERLRLDWTAANTDPEVFGKDDEFDPARNGPLNLVYGTGKHVCPGRELATVELRQFTRALLSATQLIHPDTGLERVRSVPPAGGYAAVPLVLR
mgnify:FL=1